jgi:tetratricopeptide (TPR) repeat protein
MNIKKLLNVFSILIITVLLLSITGLLVKYFVIDPKEKKAQLITLVKKYYDEKDYVTAKTLSVNLFTEFYKDREVIELFDKILIEEKQYQANLENQRRREQQEFLSLITSIVNKGNKNEILARIKELQNRYANNNTNTNSNNQVFTSVNPELNGRIYLPEVKKTLLDGISAFNSSKYLVAKSKFLEVAKTYPNDPFVNNYLAYIIYNEDPENDSVIEDAAKRCKTALKEDNTLELSHLVLASIYEHKGMIDDSILEYNETLKINPANYKVFYSLGKVYFGKNNFEDAEKYLTQSVGIKKDFLEGYFYLASTQVKLSKTEEARGNFNKILSINPKYVSAVSGIADIYFDKSDFKNAALYYEKVLDIKVKGEYLYKLGLSYKELKDDDKALAYLEKACDKNPENIDYQYELAQMYFSMKKYNDAKSVLLNIKKKAPNYMKMIEVDRMLSSIGS